MCDEKGSEEGNSRESHQARGTRGVQEEGSRLGEKWKKDSQRQGPRSQDQSRFREGKSSQECDRQWSCQVG